MSRWPALVLTAVMMLPGLAQIRPARTEAADWPMYNRDLAGTRYSPLTDINAANVAALTRVWSYPLGRDRTAGTLKWYFQTVHHDLWDYDLPSPPSLLDVTVNGRTTPIAAQTSKTGYMYILDRVTGKPVFGIEERPVPSSAVPEEQSAPTQPIPVKPPPIARVAFQIGDIVTAGDTSEEHAKFCRELMERSGGFYNAGPFTPYVYHGAGAKPYSTVLFPGSIGGANRGGTAVDPDLGYVFVNTNDEASIGWVEKTPADGSSGPAGRAPIVATASSVRRPVFSGPKAIRVPVTSWEASTAGCVSVHRGETLSP
jgi:glucose dehydrogenase